MFIDRHALEGKPISEHANVWPKVARLAAILVYQDVATLKHSRPHLSRKFSRDELRFRIVEHTESVDAFSTDRRNPLCDPPHATTRSPPGLNDPGRYTKGDSS